MAMLGSHIQVTEGLLTALSELVLVAGGDLAVADAERLLQPVGLGERVPDVIRLTIDAAEWAGLVVVRDGRVAPSESLLGVERGELQQRLPSLVRRGMLRSAPGEPSDERTGDLVRALAWFLAQDAWDPPLAFDRVQGSAEARLARQFPNGQKVLNGTKWVALCRWAVYLGFGVPEVKLPTAVLPDPTEAVRDELGSSGRDVWTARECVEYLGSQCPVLDGGVVRVQMLEGVEPSELGWEHDDAVISPSLSVAIGRLEHEGALEVERSPDAPLSERRSLSRPGPQLVIDWVRLVRGKSNG